MEVLSVTNEVEEPYWIINKYGKKDWTRTGIQAVIALYELKVPIKEIAAKLDCTKNVIVGVIHRARERGDMPRYEAKPTKTEKRVRKRVHVGPKKDPITLKVKAMVAQALKPVVVPKVRLKVIKSPTAVTLEGLKPHMCKWPLGDPRYSDFRYCGGQRLEPGPYCAEHYLLGTQPSRHK